MVSPLTQQLDFIFFVYGLSFILLAAICQGMRQDEGRRLPWKWLGLFALVHGLGEWLDLLAFSLGDPLVFAYFRAVVMLVSFMFLFEFGRLGLARLHLPVTGRWIHLPLLIVVLPSAVLGVPVLQATARYAFGLTGGILMVAAVLSLRSTLTDAAARRTLLAAAAVTGGYTLANCLVVPAAGFGPNVWLNQEWFLRVTGVPIQMLRGALAAALAALLWVYYRHSRRVKYRSMLRGRGKLGLPAFCRRAGGGRRRRLLRHELAGPGI